MKASYIAIIVVLAVIGFFVWRHMKQKKRGELGSPITAPGVATTRTGKPAQLSQQGAPPEKKKGGRKSFFGKIRGAAKQAASKATSAGAGYLSAYTGGIVSAEQIKGVAGQLPGGQYIP